MGNRTWHAPRHPPSIPVWLLLAAVLLPTELQAQRRNRDDWQRVPDVIAALAIGEGSRVADVGAGSGYFTEHLAAEVGAIGRVFAVDISQRALSQLRRLVEDQGLDNVEVVRGEPDDPKLPERSLDAVLVVDAYHEMTEYQAMLSGMFRALKPGGRLVILDLIPSNPSQSRDRQTASHELSIALAEQEVREAGFEVLKRDELFAESGRHRGQWMLVARR
ncbi:MAG: class I SAM-dependent methyltransferase [Gemmatimonadota bacterium]|nr:MAG: class I SAM-dependent methyltransferase [Gemmatimonadota bacterium]